jgi:hypothetical protein
MQSLPNVKKPCKHCPFKKTSLKGWLGHRIENDLKADNFVCHKKTELQCAGHMLLKGEENRFVQFAKLLKIPLELSGRELVFDTKEDCILHHQL